MIAALLPGARELRTPVVTGVTLALAAWVMWGDGFPTQSEATGFLERAYQAAGSVGASTALVVASFACYLVGSIYVGSFLEPIKRLLARRAVADVDLWRITKFLGDQVEAEEARTIEELTGDVQAASHADDEAVHDYLHMMGIRTYRRTALAVIGDSQGLRPRLLIESRDLYDEMDREEAEADLRLGLSVPLLLLIAALSATWTPWVSLAIAGVVLLAWQGFTKLRLSRLVMVEAVVQGIVTSTEIQAMVRDLPQHVKFTVMLDGGLPLSHDDLARKVSDGRWLRERP